MSKPIRGLLGRGKPRFSRGTLPPTNEAGGTGTIVPLHGFRSDGLPGTDRALGPVMFAPNAVDAALLPLGTVWDENDIEVPHVLTDKGARHAGVAPNSLLIAELELNVPFAAAGSMPTYTLRFDRPRTLAPLTPQGPTTFLNPLDLGLASNGLAPRVLSPFTFHHYTEDIPRRHPGAQDVLWPTATLGKVLVGQATYAVARFALTVDINFVLRAYHLNTNAASALTGGDFTRQAPAPYPNEQIVGYFKIFVAEGASITLGSTNLATDPNVTVTVTDSPYPPFSVLLSGVQRSTITNRDPVDMTLTEFSGEKIGTAAQWRALGPGYAGVQNLKEDTSSDHWHGGGMYCSLSSGGGTNYGYPLVEWLLYAETGRPRHYRRALGYGRYAVDYHNSVNWAVPEAMADIVGHHVYAILSGDDSFTANISKVTLGDETSSGLGRQSTWTSFGMNTGRRGMHAFGGFAWWERRGLDSTAAYPAYVLNPTNDYFQWPDAASWRTVATNKERFDRLMSRHLTYAGVDASHPENVGRRYFTLEGYYTPDPPKGLSPWMQGASTSNMVLGFRVFGAPPGGEAFVEDVTAFLFFGVSPVDSTNLYIPDPGKESFVYSTPSAGTPSVNGTGTILNGFLFRTFGHLLQRTQQAFWRRYGDRLYQAINNRSVSDPFYQPAKALAEIVRETGGWYWNRQVTIPGVSGVLYEVALERASATLVMSPGVPETDTFAVVSALDELGDAVSLVGAGITWSSSNPAVATVTNGGVVSTVAAGTTTLTAFVTVAGVTKSASVTLTVRHFVMKEDFLGSGAPDAGRWTATVSGSATNVVGNGVLSQTLTNVSNATVIEPAGRDLRDKTVRLGITPAHHLSMTATAHLVDAAGVGIGVRVQGSTRSVGTITNGLASPAFTAISGTSVALAVGTTPVWDVLVAANGAVTVRLSLDDGVTWSEIVSALAITGFDPQTARVRLTSSIGGNGVGPLVTAWRMVYIF